MNFYHTHRFIGDYRIGERLLIESASVITLCNSPPPAPQGCAAPVPEKFHVSLSVSDLRKVNFLNRSRTPSPEPSFAPVPAPPVPRRMVVLILGLKPHRKIWTSSQRPSESVINYQLLNGCPSIVVPVKLGAPLLAWDSLTLEQLWQVELPPDGGTSTSGKFEGITKVLFEYLDLCVDWDRVVVPGIDGPALKTEEGKKLVLKNSLEILLAAVVRSVESREVKKEVDKERCGIAMWRIP